MAQQKFRMPQSTGGLVTYYESTKEAVKIKPEHVLVVSAVIIALEIAVKVIF